MRKGRRKNEISDSVTVWNKPEDTQTFALLQPKAGAPASKGGVGLTFDLLIMKINKAIAKFSSQVAAAHIKRHPYTSHSHKLVKCMELPAKNSPNPREQSGPSKNLARCVPPPHSTAKRREPWAFSPDHRVPISWEVSILPVSPNCFQPSISELTGIWWKDNSCCELDSHAPSLPLGWFFPGHQNGNGQGWWLGVGPVTCQRKNRGVLAIKGHSPL